MIDAWQRTGWFGLGTGMNTGAARHAVAGYVPDHIENWYAKALVEFGPAGLAVLVALMVALIVGGWRALARTEDDSLRYAGAAIVAFIAVMALHNLKGWQLDLDPINAYFWLFSGFCFDCPISRRLAAAAAADRGEDIVLVAIHHRVIKHNPQRFRDIRQFVIGRHVLEPFELIGFDLDRLDDLALLHGHS